MANAYKHRMRKVDASASGTVRSWKTPLRCFRPGCVHLLQLAYSSFPGSSKLSSLRRVGQNEEDHDNVRPSQLCQAVCHLAIPSVMDQGFNTLSNLAFNQDACPSEVSRFRLWGLRVAHCSRGSRSLRV